MHFIDQFAQRAKNYIATTTDNDPVYPTEGAIHEFEKFDLPRNTKQILH